jgi:L-glyceraldehyde 3-phosphate reductase
MAQLEESLAALHTLAFSPGELSQIDRHASEGDVDLWKVLSGLVPADLLKKESELSQKACSRARCA